MRLRFPFIKQGLTTHVGNENRVVCRVDDHPHRLPVQAQRAMYDLLPPVLPANLNVTHAASLLKCSLYPPNA